MPEPLARSPWHIQARQLRDQIATLEARIESLEAKIAARHCTSIQRRGAPMMLVHVLPNAGKNVTRLSS